MSAPTALRAAGTRVMLVVLYWLLMAALLGFLAGVVEEWIRSR
jgi:lipopolysaccharide export LptBFGC system permease protein LptF